MVIYYQNFHGALLLIQSLIGAPCLISAQVQCHIPEPEIFKVPADLIGRSRIQNLLKLGPIDLDAGNRPVESHAELIKPPVKQKLFCLFNDRKLIPCNVLSAGNACRQTGK